jgi:hypothetical protein
MPHINHVLQADEGCDLDFRRGRVTRRTPRRVSPDPQFTRDKSSPMQKQPQGLAGGLTNYGDPAFAAYLRRSFRQVDGLFEEDAGVAGDRHHLRRQRLRQLPCGLPELLDPVKRGVLAAGGLQRDFPVTSLGEVFLNPTSMMFRN